MFKKGILFCYLFSVIFILSGCVSPGINAVELYPAPKNEADWVRNAEPIEFENELWYPVDDVENLLDQEMLPMGTFREVQFFVEKQDIKPYERIYTKFSKHKYRVFERTAKK